MSGQAGGSRRDELVVLFNEAEHLVLAHWFGEEVSRGPRATRAEIDRALDSLGIPDEPFDDLYDRVDAAVARILLEADEKQLPNWCATRTDGTVISTRQTRSAAEKPRRKVALHSQHLLTINWADSGPGFSWPESYRLIWVPGYDRHVLTASNDGGIDGCAPDAALAAICPCDSAELLERVGESIKRYWAWAASCSPDAWAYCFSEGLISEEAALAWRDEVWCEEAGT